MDNQDSTARLHVEKRKYQRYSIPVMVTCRFLEEEPNRKSSFQGFMQSISLGGALLEIRDDFLSIGESKLTYAPVEMNVEFHFPDGAHRINLLGIIRWHKRVKKPRGSFLYLRIQFNALDEKSLEILTRFLSLGTGDRNLIWNLWDAIQTKGNP